jgi:thioredoxin-dependent peroxiredoxin
VPDEQDLAPLAVAPCVERAPGEGWERHVGIQIATAAEPTQQHRRSAPSSGTRTIPPRPPFWTTARPDTEEVVRAAAAAGFPLTPEEGSNVQRIPADFLIGPDGIVLIAHYGEYTFDHLPFEVIEEALGAGVAV